MQAGFCWKAALTAICALATIGPASGAPPAVIEASDAAANDLFGRSVAIDADTLVVGAYAEDDAGISAGAAYVYRWDGVGWAEEAKLTASDAGGGENFGYAVAIDGDTIVVGAWRENAGAGSDQGAAYVFTRSGTIWTEQDKLVAGDGASGDRFGVSVDVDGDTVIVGAHLHDGAAGNDQGAAYIFRRSAGVWTEQAQLLPSDAFVGAEFGFDVGVSGGTVVVGAPDGVRPFGAQQNLTLLGTAYIFTESADAWTEDAAFGSSDAQVGERFGASVAIDGDRAIVGATDKLVGSNFDQGAAYIFERSAGVWSEQQKLTASDGATDDFFGTEVAIDGRLAVVGAPFRDGLAGGDEGGAYVFLQDAGVWSEEIRLDSLGIAAGAEFGAAVAIDGEFVAAGAWLNDGLAGATQGAAVVFDRTGGRWPAPDQKVLASDPVGDEQFGWSVAIDGDTAIVGAVLGDGPASFNQGTAYVFTRSGSSWTQQAKLTASDAAALDVFGISVALDGDTAIIGASGDDGVAGNDGSAYIFIRSGSSWTEQAKLTASDAAESDQFGASVAIDGDTVVVGAISGSAGAVSSGAAYIFTRSGSAWTERAKLTASDAADGDEFGRSVAIFSGTAIIGADADDDAGDGSGSVYVFTRTGASWAEQAKLTASDAAAGDRFGVAVALDGDTVIIGADLDDDALDNSGSAYIFVRNGASWSEQAKLTPLNGFGGDLFGSAVSIDGDTAVIGAYDRDSGGDAQGAAYVFTRSGSSWIERATLVAPDGAGGDAFGNAVAIDNGQALIGAPTDDDAAGFNQGSVRFIHVGDDGLPSLIYNSSLESAHATLSDAFAHATPFDSLEASTLSFGGEPSIDTLTPLIIESTQRVRTPHTTTLSLGGGSLLASAPGEVIEFFGPASIGPGSSVFSGAGVRIGAPFSLAGGSLQGTTIEISDDFIGDGELVGDTTNNAAVTIVADSIHRGDYTNNGATTIQNGTLTVLGTLTDNGTIVGDFSAIRASGGMFIEDDYTAGTNAALTLLGGRAAFGANADIAINDNARYDMATSELRMVGLAGATQTLERMSADIGPLPDGLDRTLPGHYPIDTLRIGPTAATVDLVDAHDNDNLGQAACEAVYVRNLVIDAGATLNTNGCPVYYETLTLEGGVDDPANLIQIAQCEADLTGDGQVDGADLGLLLGSWGTAQGDLTGDGVTDGADLGLLLGAWGPCF